MLQYQTLPVTFTGIDQKTDDFILQPGRMVDVKNMWMDRTGKLQARNGFDTKGGALASALAVSEWYGDPLRWSLRSADIPTAAGSSRQTAISILAGSMQTYDVGGELETSLPEFSYAEGPDYGVFAKLSVDYTTAGNPTVVELQFVDLESRKTFYFERKAGSRVGVVTTGSGVAVVRLAGTSLKVDHYVGLSGGGFPDLALDNVTWLSGVTIGDIDICYMDDYIAAVYTTTDTRFATFNISTSAAASAQVSALVADHVSIARDSVAVAIVFAWYDTSYSCSFTVCTAPNTIGATTSVVNYGGLSYSPDNITCYSNGVTRHFVLDWDYNAPVAGTYTSAFSGPNHLEYYSVFGTTVAAKQVFFGARIASRPFTYQSNTMIYASSEAPTTDQTNNCMCLLGLSFNSANALQNDLIFSSRARPTFTNTIMSEVNVASTDIVTALPYSGNARRQGRVIVRSTSIKPVFAFWNGVQLHNVTPHLSYFDGRESRPIGFPGWPIIKSLTKVTSGSLTGTYGYSAIWERVDQFGNVWRSAPAVVASVAPSSENVTVQIWAPPFFDTNEDDYRLIVYRTVANGSIYYELGTFDPYDGTPYVSFTDSTADSVITSNPLLYTDGGVLENVAPPACTSFGVSKDRVFLISAEDNSVFASKPRVNGEGVNFSDALQVNISSSRTLTSVGVMDEKVLIFGDTTTWVVYGNGPDDLGNGVFETQILSDDLGCIEPRSIMLGDAGVYFQSEKGLWLYSRDLSSAPIGIPVDLYKNETIVGTANPPDKLLHMWFCASGTILVWDEYHQIWTRFVTAALKSGCIVDGKQTALISTGAVYQENTSSYLDASVGYECKVDTGWMSFAGLQGFQKIRKVSVVGESQTADFNLVMTMAYDFIDTTVSTYTISNTTVKPTGTAYQWEVKPNRQKCESLRITMAYTTASLGASIIGVSFEVGQLPGTARRKDLAKRVTGV